MTCDVIGAWRQIEHITMCSNSYEFKYLGSLLTNQNSIHEEVKCRIKSRKFLLFSLNMYVLLFENFKIKVYKTVILPGVLYGCETWSLTLR